MKLKSVMVQRDCAARMPGENGTPTTHYRVGVVGCELDLELVKELNAIKVTRLDGKYKGETVYVPMGNVVDFQILDKTK